MAVNLFTGATDSNFGTATNWSLGTVPTATDTHTTTFDATSPNCTVNTSARVCNHIDFTGYTNTITMTQSITVSGNITLSAGMLISGAATLSINATGTMTSNGKTWPNAFTFAGTSQTYTLADVWTVTGTVTGNAVTGLTVNGSTLNCGSTLNVGAAGITGTTNLVMIGTGNWSGAGVYRNNLEFNSAGTITIGSMAYNTGILKYTAGTMAVSGTLTIAASTTLNTNGMSWAAVTISAVSTITNSSILTITGTFLISGSGSNVINGSDVYIQGGYSASSGRNLSGTAEIIVNGSASQNFNASISAVISNDLTFDSSGTITITNGFTYTTGIFTYVAGTIITTGSTMTFSGSCTLNLAGISWNNITFSANSTITLNSLLTCTGTATITTVSVVFTGTSGWTFGTFVVTTGNHTLESGLTYTITTNFTVTGTAANTGSFIASASPTKAILTLQQGATQDVGFCDGTRMDSSLGQTIWTYKGTITTSFNWNLLPVQPATITSAN